MVRKYSYEFKKKLVSQIETSGSSIRCIGREYGISRGVLWQIYNRYKKYGDISLYHTYTRNNYSREFKLYVLKYKELNKIGYEKTALYFNIPSPSVICDWYKQYGAELEAYEMKEIPEHTPKNPKQTNNTEEVSELEALKTKIATLEKLVYKQATEVEILKKYDALMQGMKQKKRRR